MPKSIREKMCLTFAQSASQNGFLYIKKRKANGYTISLPFF